MAQKKKHLSGFGIGMIVLLVLGVAVITFFVCQIDVYLTKFERNQPDVKAEEIYREYYQGLPDYLDLIDRSGVKLSNGETAQDLADYLVRTQGDETLLMEQVYAENPDMVRYVLMAGETKMAAFNLKRGDVVTFTFYDHPFTKFLGLFSCYHWSLDSMELFYEGAETVLIRAPYNGSVYVNGTKVDEEKIVGETEWDPVSAAHMPEGVRGLGFVTYEVTGLLRKPEVTVFNFKNEPMEVKETAEGYFDSFLINDEELALSAGERILQGVKIYACYMQEEAGIAEVRDYFDKNSAIFEAIRTTVRVVWEHDSYTFENVSVHDFVAYDENTFSCTVELQHVLTKGKSVWKDEPLNMTVYCRKIMGEYMIYDMVNN